MGDYILESCTEGQGILRQAKTMVNAPSTQNTKQKSATQ
jgi:hypothetical protein